MTDIANVQTAEAVAFELLKKVMLAEGKRGSDADRKYILDTYAECLTAAKDKRFTTS